MPRGVYIVFTNPASPELEDEYNRFYAEVHIPELLGRPGFHGARRFRLAESAQQPVGAIADYSYVTIYDVDIDELAKTREERAAAVRARSGSPSVIDDSPTFAVYEEIDS